MLADTPYGPADDLDLAPLPLAAVRHDGVTIADLTRLFDAGFGALGAAAAGGVVTPIGPAVAIYHGDPMATFDLEIAFPVATPLTDPLPGEGGVLITPSSLPAGAAVATTHIGSYDGLGSGWGGLVERAAQRGIHPAGIWIEVYVSDPTDTPADELRTDLIMPTAV